MFLHLWNALKDLNLSKVCVGILAKQYHKPASQAMSALLVNVPLLLLSDHVSSLFIIYVK